MSVSITSLNLNSAMKATHAKCEEHILTKFTGKDTRAICALAVSFAMGELVKELIGEEQANALAMEAVEMKLGVTLSKLNDEERDSLTNYIIKRMIRED